MEDFNALAAAVAAGVSDVRGCLILSRDGLVLGAYPPSGEEAAKPAWLRLAGIGDFERGFLQFGTEIWCYVRRGPYAAFTLTGQGVRPGLVIDQMEQALLAAEESRARREGLRPEPTTATAPSGKPRTPLHPEPRGDEPPLVVPAELSDAGVPAAAPAPVEQIATASSPAEPSIPATPAGPAVGPTPMADAPAPARGGPEAPPDEPEGPDGSVDRFSLAREFSQLLQDEGGAADG